MGATEEWEARDGGSSFFQGKPDLGNIFLIYKNMGNYLLELLIT